MHLAAELELSQTECAPDISVSSGGMGVGWHGGKPWEAAGAGAIDAMKGSRRSGLDMRTLV